jgi:formate/nitrite transporter FocA (FNT family)
VWATYAAKDTAGKVLVVFFIIMLFAASGYEHSIANMYYIPAGILAAQNPLCLSMSQVAPGQLAGLTWPNFIIKNLIPVTLGNIAGGAGMVGVLYWLALKKLAK